MEKINPTDRARLLALLAAADALPVRERLDYFDRASYLRAVRLLDAVGLINLGQVAKVRLDDGKVYEGFDALGVRITSPYGFTPLSDDKEALLELASAHPARPLERLGAEPLASRSVASELASVIPLKPRSPEGGEAA